MGPQPPNDKEIELIKQLRENVKDLDLCEEVLCNANLVRWIRARNQKLKDAEDMLRKYIKWFDEVELGSIFDHKIPVEVTEEAIQPICGFDRIGCPIVINAFGQVDLYKLMKEGYKREVMLHFLQTFERDAYFVRYLMAEQQKSDSLILYSCILDMEGLSWTQIASTDVIQLLITVAKTFEANYPETLHKIIVINAPTVFTILYSIIKPFVSGRTMEKVQIYGKNREQWQEALFKLASNDSLPKKYGGTLPDDVDILPKMHECTPKKRGSY